MGRLTSLAKAGAHPARLQRQAAKDAGWNRVFGGTSKEDGHGPVKHPRSETVNYRTLDSTNVAIKRMVEAMRSKAPGTWTDDRYEQSRHFVSIQYVAIHRMACQWMQAEFAVFKKDPAHQDGKRPITRDDPAEGDRVVSPYDLVRLLERPNCKDSFGKLMYRWCTPAGTLVRMADGTEKPIEQIKVREQVLTAEGNVGRVNQCMVHRHEGEMATVKLWGHNTLRLTPNHEVLTKRGYVPCGELKSDDWVCLPRYKPTTANILQTAEHVAGETTKINGRNYSRVGQVVPSTNGNPWNCAYNKVPDFLELTPGLGRIFGLYLAEGHTTKAGRICWSFNIEERDTLVAELVDLLKQELGLTASVKTMNARGTVALVYVGGKLWRRLFESLCGKYSWGKRVHSDLLCGPDVFLQGLFSGWMDGDGTTRKRGYKRGASVSHQLALSMYDIANHLGMRPILSKEKPSKLSTKKLPIWKVGVFGNSDNYRVSLETSKTWRKVRAVDKASYSGDVFNIGVEGDESYVAEGIGVHNCQQKYLTGSALTWMVPNKFGTPMELYCIPTATAVPQAAINPQFPQGYYRIQPYFPYGPFSSYPSPLTSVGATIPAEWMLEFRFPHPLVYYDGWSPQTALRLHLDEIESIDRSRWYKMKRSTNPSAVMNFKEMTGAEPLPEPELDRIHAEWENEQEGPENHGRLIVMPPGGSLDEWGARPADMEYQAGWTQLVDFAMAGMGMTKPAAGILETSNYATLFAALKQVHLLTLKPDLDDIAQELTHHLANFFGDDLIVEIRCPRIDDDDVKQRKWQMLAAQKACTINELRKAFDEPTTEEEWGKQRCGEDPQAMMQATSQPMEEAMAAEGMVPQEEGAAEEGGPPLPPELKGPGTGKLGEGSLGPRQKGMSSELRRFAWLEKRKNEGVSKEQLYDALCKSLGGKIEPPTAANLEEQAKRVSKRLGVLSKLSHTKKSFYDTVRETVANGHH